MNVHPQCCSCNSFRAGEQYLYGKRLDEIYGPGSADSVMAASRERVKWPEWLIREEIKRYNNLVSELNG